MRWCLTSSSSPYCWTCCLFVLYVIGAEALAGLLFPPLEVRQCLFVFAPRFFLLQSMEMITALYHL